MRVNIVFMMVLSLFLALAPVVVARAEGVSLAVVDVQRLLNEGKAGKSLQGQIESQRQKFQTEFSKYERDLRDSEQSLVEEGKKLSAEEYGKKRQAFEKKLLETRQLVQKRKRDLDEASAKSVGMIQEEIVKIVQKIAQDKAYQVVLTRQNVVVVDKGIDITDDVMTALNASLPDVKLTVTPGSQK